MSERKTDEDARKRILEEPYICRSAEQVMSAHDVLGFLVENRDLFKDKIHPETWAKVESALDVMCWMLGHNDLFCDVMDVLIEITEGVEKKKEATQ